MAANIIPLEHFVGALGGYHFRVRAVLRHQQVRGAPDIYIG
jgi:hypothetical protein